MATLFVKGFPKQTSEDFLKLFFGNTGAHVESVNIIRQKGPLDIAFVELIQHKDAHDLINALHNKYIDSWKLTVQFSTGRHHRNLHSPLKLFNSVHVKFRLRSSEEIRNDQILEVFQRFDEEISVTVKKRFFYRNGMQSGYAFVDLESNPKGKESVELICQVFAEDMNVGGVTYRCEKSNMYERSLQFRNQSEPAPAQTEVPVEYYIQSYSYSSLPFVFKPYPQQSAYFQYPQMYPSFIYVNPESVVCKTL